jgi:putative tricarboxylic transport membrane protein
MKDLVAGVLLLALAVFYWIEANAIPVTGFGGSISAQGLPKFLAIGLVLTSLALIAQALLIRRTVAPVPTEGEEQRWTPSNHARAAGIVAIGIGFILVVETAGFAIAVFMLLAATAIYMGQRPGLRLFLISLAGAAAFWAIFIKVLNIPLPKGLLPF